MKGAKQNVAQEPPRYVQVIFLFGLGMLTWINDSCSEFDVQIPPGNTYPIALSGFSFPYSLNELVN